MAHAGIGALVRQVEILVIFEEPEALEDRREDGFRQAEILEEEGPLRTVLRQETVDLPVEPQQLVAVLLPLAGSWFMTKR